MGCRVFFIFLEKHPDMKRLFFLSALFTLVCCSAPKSDMDRYVDDLMSRMTLDQKIGQLNLHSSPGFISAERVTEEDENTKMLREGMLGGIYGGSNTAVLKRAQEIAVEAGAGIPLIFGMDVIHGHETVFPIPLAMSTSWNIDKIEKAARIAASEASAAGINWVFSPMVDICRDARWGRIAEGAGEDPYLGGEIAKAFVRGYQGTDGVFDTDEVMACVKHYALYGAAEGGRDYNSVFLSRQEAMNGYMIPYRHDEQVADGRRAPQDVGLRRFHSFRRDGRCGGGRPRHRRPSGGLGPLASGGA
jgi:beta-glucosidase